MGWGAVNRNRMALVQEGKKLRGLKIKIKKSSEEAMMMMVMVKLLIVVMFA